MLPKCTPDRQISPTIAAFSTQLGNAVAETIRHEVEAMMIPHVASSVSAFVTISVGLVSDRCIPGTTMTQWLSAADRMLYRSKELGRNRVTGQVTGGGVS